MTTTQKPNLNDDPGAYVQHFAARVLDRFLVVALIGLGLLWVAKWFGLGWLTAIVNSVFFVAAVLIGCAIVYLVTICVIAAKHEESCSQCGRDHDEEC
jgi:phosphoglycerol transferase MdoB-like AlkP superfamily enzyme